MLLGVLTSITGGYNKNLALNIVFKSCQHGTGPLNSFFKYGFVELISK